MYALISPQEPIETGYRIAQIIDISHPVAEPLFWTLCSDTITSDKYFYNPTTQLCELISNNVTLVPNVTAVQIRLQLNKQGLRTQVETAIANGSQDLKDKWQYGNVFSSTDSDIQAMATSLGLTQEQLDTLFTEAATL